MTVKTPTWKLRPSKAEQERRRQHGWMPPSGPPLRGIVVDFSADPLESVPESPMTLNVIVEDIELRTAQRSYEYLDWRLGIADEPYRDRWLRHISSLSPRALPYLWESLQSFGLKDPRVTFEFDDRVVGSRKGRRIEHHLLSPDLIGQSATVVVKNGTYKDQPQLRVVRLAGSIAS